MKRYYFREEQPNNLGWTYGPWYDERERDERMKNHAELYPLRTYLPLERED